MTSFGRKKKTEKKHIITLHSEQPIQQEVQAMLSLESTITKNHINKLSGVEH